MKTKQTESHMHISIKILYFCAELAHHYWIINRCLWFNNQKIISHTSVGSTMWNNIYSLAPLAHLNREIDPSTCEWGLSCSISRGRDRTDNTWSQSFNSKWKRFEILGLIHVLNILNVNMTPCQRRFFAFSAHRKEAICEISSSSAIKTVWSSGMTLLHSNTAKWST